MSEPKVLWSCTWPPFGRIDAVDNGEGSAVFQSESTPPGIVYGPSALRILVDERAALEAERDELRGTLTALADEVDDHFARVRPADRAANLSEYEPLAMALATARTVLNPEAPEPAEAPQEEPVAAEPWGVTAYVHLPGDPGVGIPHHTIEVLQIPPFEDEDQRKEARHVLAEAFETIGGWGGPTVEFSDDPPEPEWEPAAGGES